MTKKKWIIAASLLSLLLPMAAGCDFFGTEDPEYTYWEPSLSPDTTMLIYESTAELSLELFTLNLSTQVETQLTNNDYADWSPAWSPDGRRIAFASSRDENVDIYVIDLSSLETVRLTTHELDDINPSWGVDGDIYFNSNRSDAWEAYAIDPDTFTLRKLTSLDASMTP
ncbi:PD40 domain-containing protein [Candidatus Bipolaricaulota bacterium]|nr:PD40 domain-containing protein [Candidatus Bipolaricaulota bacterium]